jgi:hypothetical protein
MSKQKRKKVAFFEDDLVLSGKVPEQDYFPAVNFTFKPLTVLETAKLSDTVITKGLSVEKATEENLRVLATKLVSWDLTDKNDNIVDFTKIENLRRVAPSVMNGIIGRVRGDFGTPEDDVMSLQDELKN